MLGSEKGHYHINTVKSKSLRTLEKSLFVVLHLCCYFISLAVRLLESLIAKVVLKSVASKHKMSSLK